MFLMIAQVVKYLLQKILKNHIYLKLMEPSFSFQREVLTQAKIIMLNRFRQTVKVGKQYQLLRIVVETLNISSNTVVMNLIFLYLLIEVIIYYILNLHYYPLLHILITLFFKCLYL